MKKLITLCILFLAAHLGYSQSDKDKIVQACLNYLEGFYNGDTTRLIQSLKPSLYKFGYWKNKDTGKYGPDGHMTYRQAIDYAKGVMEKKNFAKSDAPKKVEVLDIQRTIAAAKVTAWWGVDYILLARLDDQWMIEQVLWEGPLEK